MRIHRLECCLPFAAGRDSGRVRRHTGRAKVWHGGLASVALAIMLVGGWSPAARAAATQAPYAAVCQLPQSEIRFTHLPTMGEFDASQMRFAPTDPNYYPRELGGLTISAVSATLPVSFPAKGSKIRFFYVADQRNKYDEPIRLVACLYFDRNGKAYALSHAYAPEGNALPVIVSMFTEDLSRAVGQTLFIVIRWRIENAAMSGTAYDLHAYGVKGITEPASQNNWNKFGLPGFVANVFGDNSWNISDTNNETIQSVHAYTDKAAIVKRLKHLGYLK